MTTIPEVFASLASSPRTANHPAVIGSHAVTFAELFANAQSRVHELRADAVGTGDVVAIVCYNEVEFFEYLIAAGQLGAALVPLSPALSDRDLVALLGQSAAAVCYCSAEVGVERTKRLREQVTGPLRAIGPPIGASVVTGDVVVPASDSVCWISTTGGSTGLPRLFATSHERLLGNLFINAVQWGWTAHPVHLALAPLAHGIGFCHALGQLITGGTVVLVKKYSAAIAAEVRSRDQSAWTAVVPTMLRDIVEYSHDKGIAPERLKLIICAGASLSSGLRDRVLALGSGCRLIEYYGSTELGWVTWIEHRTGDERNDLVGWPTIGSIVRIVTPDGVVAESRQIGRIERRGRPYMVPFVVGLGTVPIDATEVWETSGDLAYIDQDGAAVLVGREDDMITVGGLNVYPVEVEAVLREHPAVRDAIVVGVESDRLGHELKAFVELRDGSNDTLAAELLEFSASRLAKHKRPHSITLVEALPRTTSRKTDRKITALIKE